MTTALPRMSRYLILGFALIAFSFLPWNVRAAEAPSCVLIVSTPRGNAVFEGKKDIEVRAGERLFIGRIGLNASEAKDREGKSVPGFGLEILTAPSSERTYSYRYANGGEEATCSVTLTVEGAKKETVAKKSSAKKEKPAATGGTLSVSQLPLLAGGTGLPGASVPVAYVKVANPGKETASIEGFTLAQNGSAPTSAIARFATNDDKGGSRASVAASFKGKEAFVPLAAEIAPGQTRIFTVKAELAKDGGFAGKQLMLDVASVKTGASLKGAFPLRGVVWGLVR